VLIGRDAEMVAVGRAVRAVQDGQAARIAICGEPGIGKSRLAQEACAVAERRGCRVLGGRATEFEQHVPFAILTSALDNAIGSFAKPALARLAPDRLAELALVFPGLAGTRKAGAPRLPVERYRLHEAFGTLLNAIAALRPTVLVLDDLHWADAASIELVAQLLGQPATEGLLLVLVHRQQRASPELLAAITGSVRDGTLTDLDLRSLGEAEALPFLEGIDARARTLLYQESGGNPFYLEELAHAHRRDARSLPARDGALKVPLTVQTVIAQEELRRLTPRSKLAMQAASVLGDPFDPAVVAVIAQISEAEALAAIDEAAAFEFVQPAAETRMLRFRHPIVRRAIYESGGPAWRIAAHRRAGQELARRGASPALRASHVQRSAERGDEDAVELLVAAARNAAARAPRIAARWYGVALDLLPVDAGAARHVELLVPLATSLTAAGQNAESRDVLERLLAMLPDEEADLRARVILMIARADQMLGRQGRARRMVDDEIASSENPASRCVLRLALCIDHWYSRKPLLVGSCAMAALNDARAAERQELIAEAMAQAALGSCESGATEEALLWLDAAQWVVDGLRDEQLAHRIECLGVLGHANRSVDRYDRAAALFERALRIVRETGQEWFLVPLTVGLTNVNVGLGRLDRAVADAEAARSAASLTHDPQLMLWSELVVSRAALARGDLRAALTAGVNATTLARDSWNTLLAANAHVALAAAQIASGEAADARQRILDNAGGPELSLIERFSRPRCYRLLVESELAGGKRDAAGAWARLARRAAGELELTSATATADCCEALVLLDAGEACAAAEHADRAADGFRSIAAATEAGGADLLAGRALARAGDTSEAITRLKHAHGTLAACCAARSRDEAARELRALGVRGRASRGLPAGGPATLTRREREIARLMANGLTNRQIAERLVVSVKTVETHASRVLTKLGVASRVAVAAFMLPPC
jgi:DNA-binding CsgD family transcriptional regulator/tetratricopeptide (TPR) repeat protein